MQTWRDDTLGIELNLIVLYSKAKILPLKLHVDQDALDFLKKFFSFSDPDAEPSSSKDETFFREYT